MEAGKIINCISNRLRNRSQAVHMDRNPLYKYELYAACWENILGASAFYIAPGAASDSAAVYFECAWRLERSHLWAGADGLYCSFSVSSAVA